MRPLLTAIAATLAFGLGAFAMAQDLPSTAPGAEPEIEKDAKPKATVAFAKSWEAAVEEGKLLNLPIVIHSHGFY